MPGAAPAWRWIVLGSRWRTATVPTAIYFVRYNDPLGDNEKGIVVQAGVLVFR